MPFDGVSPKRTAEQQALFEMGMGQTRKQWRNGGKERRGRRYREAHRRAQNNRCRLCGVEMDTENSHVATPTACTLDHIVPLSHGGAHSFENTQALCWTCNMTKSYDEK